MLATRIATESVDGVCDDECTRFWILALNTSQWATAAYCLCIAGGLHAAQQSEPQDPHHTDVEHMLVSDQQLEQRRSITDIDLASFTGFAKLIDRSEFDHRFVDFSDLLDTLPGIQVSQSGGTGTFSSVSVRGSSGKQVNIFLDGLLLNSPNSGSASVSRIPSVLIERVEAYPDFTPAQLGNANLAGAINFKSRDLGSAKPGAKLSLARGSFGLKNAEVSAWGKIAEWELIGGGSTLTTDNDFPVDPGIFTTTAKRRRNDGYTQDSVFLKAGRRWEGGQFTTLLQSSESEKELPTTLNQLRDNATLDNQSWRLQSVLDYQIGKIDIGHRAFVAGERDTYRDPDSTVGLGEDHTETELDGVGLFNTARLIAGEHEWVMSLELRQDDITQQDKLNREDLIDAQRNTAILALANSWCINDQWLVNATLRQYWVEDEVDFSLRDFAASDDIDESAVNVGAQWRPSAHLIVKANAGLLVRIPTLSEKFGSRGLFEGNADLQPEQALNFDTGVALTWPRFNLDANIFYRQTDDGIVTLFDSRGVGQPQNIAQSETVGIESEASYRLTEWLTINANATLLDTENQSNIRAAKGKQLPGIYHQSAGAGLIANTGIARFEVHYQHHDELYYESANAVEADAKKELNVSATTSWRALTLDFSAHNLLDENFLDMNRFPTPGRSYVITVSAEI